MKITDKDVSYVADLAHLDLTAEERTRMVRDLNSILGYIDQMNELDTSNVPPMAQVSDRFGTDANKKGSQRIVYAMREDEVRPSLPHELALANAPDKDENFFKVPKVIER
jgi:aspartyl-tRNA(Asn)/glutamyl-tRNA(Gln) amidotransferase subunit C